MIGRRVKVAYDLHVGMEGTVPKGAMGTYRGQSGDIENYHLIEMDDDHDFLTEAYGVKNCLLADKVNFDAGELNFSETQITRTFATSVVVAPDEPDLDFDQWGWNVHYRGEIVWKSDENTFQDACRFAQEILQKYGLNTFKVMAQPIPD